MSLPPPIIKILPEQQDYTALWQAMKTFTQQRDPATPDEIWFLEHTPVFTLGQAGKLEHVLNPGAIPVVRSDRGGQVTYHGPGQLVVYVLLDLKRLKLGIRGLVTALEEAVIRLLADYQIVAHARREAPGVYVGDAKICSVGLRVRKGCTYHGLALNVNMDLTPFSLINPCGYEGLTITQLADLGGPSSIEAVQPVLCQHLLAVLGLAEV